MKIRQHLRPGSLPLTITYIVLIVISVVMFVQAREFPASSMGPASPGFFPQVVAGLIILLCVAGLIELRLKSPPPVSFPRRVVLGIFAAFLYVGVMYVVGYYPSTFLFSVFIMWLVRGQVSLVRIVIDSAVLVAVAYLLFDVMIGAVLPPGTLFE
ncbi:MAG: tripartite tricarboxylate transporter TctB family protein [Hyphomicrobiaceae bacterium]|nr:tripartite tricarboxylate transporter TctB family protein [Hyphomicrobiaceae bacterium]